LSRSGLAVATIALSFAALWLPLVRIGFYGFPSVLVFGFLSDIREAAHSGGFAIGMASAAALEVLVFVLAVAGLRYRLAMLTAGILAMMVPVVAALAMYRLPSEIGEGVEALASLLVGLGDSVLAESLVAPLALYAAMKGEEQ
jgi:hypothetical protein